MFVCKFQTQFNQFNISIYSGNEQDLFQLNRYRGQNEAQLTISARQNILDYEVPENRLRILQVSKAYLATGPRRAVGREFRGSQV